MTGETWISFDRFRAEFKIQCKNWLIRCGYPFTAPEDNTSSTHRATANALLHHLQAEAAHADGCPFYPIETPIVYNYNLDAIQQHDTIKLIIVSDNPGKNEQLHKNQRYLVGQAGKVAENFFMRHPELNIDFRKEVIVLNKTPVHTAKTKELRYLLKHSTADFASLFEETQCWLARKTALLQKALGCSLWLVGYGELRKKSLFTMYAKTLQAVYRAEQNIDMIPVFVFQHFSMSCFANDLRRHYDYDKTITENLHTIGLAHRYELLGW